MALVHGFGETMFLLLLAVCILTVLFYKGYTSTLGGSYCSIPSCIDVGPVDPFSRVD
jgi:hypothetical protein